MKDRPRSVEREVAYWLSLQFKELGFATVERIPILGRTGPDITINELGLVIDVKSRLSVPIGAIISRRKSVFWPDEGYFGTRLCNLTLSDTLSVTQPDKPLAKTVIKWYEHMDEWRRNYFPEGITALILHRPGTWVKNSTFIIHFSDKEKLYDRYTKRNHDYGIPAEYKSCALGGVGRFTPGYSKCGAS